LKVCRKECEKDLFEDLSLASKILRGIALGIIQRKKEIKTLQRETKIDVVI
jgi:hypothetical protein